MNILKISFFICLFLWSAKVLFAHEDYLEPPKTNQPEPRENIQSATNREVGTNRSETGIIEVTPEPAPVSPETQPQPQARPASQQDNAENVTTPRDQENVKRVTPNQPARPQQRPQARPPTRARPEIVRPERGRPAGAGRPEGARRPNRR